MSAERTLTLDQVRPGAALPELAVDVSATTVVLRALASRDWRPMHHDKDFAQQRNGVRDIFLNTPNQAAWFERYLTDWTGPYGRLGRMRFRMRDSIFPGDRMVFHGRVETAGVDDTGCGWAEVALRVTVGERVTGRIGRGVLALIGIQRGDDVRSATRLLERVLGYRIFEDDTGRMNRSLTDIAGGLLLVPQFTLAADTDKGMRAGFSRAEQPEVARASFSRFVELARARRKK